MDINRDNYMVWITDFYDGALKAPEKEALYSFLDLHPDLKEEFEIFNELKLHPEISTRISKESLHKNITDLDPELSAEEYDTLTNEIGSPEELEESASLVLIPENIVYPDKNKLKRIPLWSRTFKIAVRSLSAAATIAILFSLYLILPDRNNITESYTMASMQPFNSQTLEPVSKRLVKNLSNKRVATLPLVIQKASEDLNTETLNANNTKEDIIPRSAEVSIIPAAYKYSSRLNLVSEDSAPTALASMQEIDIPIDQPNLSPRQFLALNFRKHLLKKNTESSENLKVYEVADVGINGLNKLLGWEMQFESETNEEGRLKAYKFTSQLINLDRKTKIADD